MNTFPIYADAHADVFFTVAREKADIVSGRGARHMTLAGMRRANQRLQVCSLWTPPQYAGVEAEAFAFDILDALDATTRRWSEHFVKVETPDALRRAAADPTAPIALIPWIEGASPLRGSLDVFDAFARRGVKGIGLTWNHANETADGCGVPEPRRGLSAFGRELVEAMEARRVLVDAAHLPEPAFFDLLAMVRRPVVVSHCGMRALVPITRNVSDRMASAIADSGGFVGIDFYHGHIWEHSGRPCARRATTADLARHIVHAVNVCGENNVVLGGDFDGFEEPIIGLERVDDVPRLADALKTAGLSARQVEKVMGLNLIERLVELW